MSRLRLYHVYQLCKWFQDQRGVLLDGSDPVITQNYSTLVDWYRTDPGARRIISYEFLGTDKFLANIYRRSGVKKLPIAHTSDGADFYDSLDRALTQLERNEVLLIFSCYDQWRKQDWARYCRIPGITFDPADVRRCIDLNVPELASTWLFRTIPRINPGIAPSQWPVEVRDALAEAIANLEEEEYKAILSEIKGTNWKVDYVLPWIEQVRLRK